MPCRFDKEFSSQRKSPGVQKEAAPSDFKSLKAQKGREVRKINHNLTFDTTNPCQVGVAFQKALRNCIIFAFLCIFVCNAIL